MAPQDTAERREFAVALLRERIAARLGSLRASPAIPRSPSRPQRGLLVTATFGPGGFAAPRRSRSARSASTHRDGQQSPTLRRHPPHRPAERRSGRPSASRSRSPSEARTGRPRTSHGPFLQWSAPDAAGNLAVVLSPSFVPRTFLDVLRHELPATSSTASTVAVSDLHAALATVVDLYLCGALAPAVVVCRDRRRRQATLARRAERRSMATAGVRLIRDIDPKVVKMSRAM